MVIMSATSTDPWLESINSNLINTSDSTNCFEDNFTPDKNRLPDSEQYLAILESKLQKIKNDPNILKQLAEKREACMQHLLTSSVELFDEIVSLDTPIETNNILRTVTPRVPVNQGEIVEFIKYDQLFEEEDSAELKETSQE